MAYYHSQYAVRRRKKSKWKKYFWGILFILVLAGGVAAYWFYHIVNDPNTWVKGDTTYVKISSQTDYQGLLDSLYSRGLIIHRDNFEWWANIKKLHRGFKPGNYKITSGMSNKTLVNMFLAGLQEPVNVVINNVRTKSELAAKLGKQLEPDSVNFIFALNDMRVAEKYGLNTENILTLFLPNTYEFYWNTPVERFFDRMQKEHQKFWNDKRLALAKKTGLSPTEVSILASIVQKETNKNDEKPKIASVYLNRLRRNWRLQADPTVVFALQDFSIRRLLTEQLEYDSPYNTYKYEGLPPGPICIPSAASIDAVLHAEETDYMYFCAKDDFSGYHAFAKTAAGHALNARKYRRALNRRKIMR